MPEGLWVKCPGCSQIIYNKDLAANLNVCPKCAHHFRISAAERLRMLFDDGRGSSTTRASSRPIRCSSPTPSRTRRGSKAGIEATGLKDAVIVGVGRASTASTTIVAAMEYGFIGGSMGVVVGEKITRAHRARDRRRAARSSSSAARAARG